MNFLKRTSNLNRKQTITQACEYFTISLLGTSINLMTFFLITEYLGVFYLISGFFSNILGASSNFVLDKTLVFKEKIYTKIGFKYIEFLTFGAISLSINLLLLWFLTSQMGFYYLFSQIIAIGVGGSFNFTMNKLYTFYHK